MMRPIIFCDMHLDVNIEKFIRRNLAILKRNNYDHFVIESDGSKTTETVEEAIKFKKQIIATTSQYSRNPIATALIRNIEEELELIREASDSGMHVHPAPNNDLFEYTMIQHFARKGKGVFASIGLTHCQGIHHFPNNYIFLYSRVDIKTHQYLNKTAPDSPPSFDSIEDTNLADIIAGEIKDSDL